MNRKRSPGAGRKPQGDYAGKSATFTTRIQPELRAALDKSAKGSKRSLSQEVERRLQESFKLPAEIARDLGPPHIRALARLVSQVGQGVELMTGFKWREDRFTSEAFRSAINILLDRFAPDTEIEVPERCDQSAISSDRHSPGLGEQLRRPDGVGAAAAFGLLSQLELLETPSLLREDGVAFAKQFYALPKIRQDLGLKSKKEKAR
jgi:hypothetical protein